MNYRLDRFDVLTAWNNYLISIKLTTKINLMDILRENKKFATSAKKRIFPYLPFKLTEIGDMRFKQLDVENWLVDLAINLFEKGKLDEKLK